MKNNMMSTLQLLLCLFLSSIVVVPLNAQVDYESPLSQKNRSKEKHGVKKIKVGYKSFTEAGVLVPNLDFEQRTFSGFSSHGIYFNNAYLGAGIGLDRYDTLSLLPLALDGRYIFTGRGSSNLKDGLMEQRGFNLFVFFSGGYAKNISKNEAEKLNGLMLQCGMGMLIGKLEDVRLTLTFGYKYQELPVQVANTNTNQYDSFNIKIGIEFRT